MRSHQKGNEGEQGGTVFAALSTAAPAFRRSMDDLVALVPLLGSAADELGVRLPSR
ncbi:hypothetical protein QBA38_02085 [Streptomyces stelliscabiei]|uniref:hypothetical protein n=1 Tax=Streptomyces stelliscabiei TaxID=146820 RepID=UPI002FF10C30